MERSWIDTEEGREAISELSQVPNVRTLVLEAGKIHTQSLVSRVMGADVRKPEKDRDLIVTKAELDGAQAMLKFLLQLINDAGRPQED